MPTSRIQSQKQHAAEAEVERFRNDLGPFVVAAEATRMAMLFTDAADPSNPIIFANDSFLALTGYEREDVLGQTFNSLMASDHHTEELADVEAAFHGSGPGDPDIHFCRKDGSDFWASLCISPVVDDAGKLVQHFVSLVDLTSYKISELALRDAVQRFKIVTRVTADVVWDWDLSAETVWWSEGMHSLFGYQVGALPTGEESWTAHIHPEDADRVLAGVRAAIAGADERWSDEYRFLREDGSCAQVLDRGFIIRDDNAKAIRVVGSMVDVTKQREVEAQLRQSQRLDAIGQLTGGIAHDFNNLLTVVLCNAETLEARLSEDPQLQKIAEMTRMAAERGGELTSRLLAFSRRQALDSKPTDVGALVLGMDALLGRALGEHVDTQIRMQSELWLALVDAPQLESAILNLCINARDAMPNGGQITIEMANVELDKAETASTSARPGKYVMISVSDTGVGMDQEALARAFEPFFTTKEVGKGSGLGLSMVHGFVEQSKGWVKIESVLGRGACIKLYLPKGGRAIHPVVHESVSPVATGGSEKILVAEDDEFVRAQVTSELEELGYQVVSVATGAQALEALRLANDLDLLFTDVVMSGGMNGRQLADAALELQPNLPVLFTSGYADAIAPQGQLDAGISLLRKPYRRRDLAAKVRETLGSVRKLQS